MRVESVSVSLHQEPVSSYLREGESLNLSLHSGSVYDPLSRAHLSSVLLEWNSRSVCNYGRTLRSGLRG